MAFILQEELLLHSFISRIAHRVLVLGRPPKVMQTLRMKNVEEI